MESEWEFFDAPSPVNDITGKPISGEIMRRRNKDGGYEYREIADSDWKFFYVFFSVKDITGKRIQGDIMRRRTEDGRYEYRKMTDAEEAEYVSREAW